MANNGGSTTCKLPGCRVRKPRTEMTRQGYCSVEHGIEAAVTAAREMAEKRGPTWEKYRKAMRKAARNL